MIEDKFKVDGTDFKKLPLRAAYYVRTLGATHDARLMSTVDNIKDFIESETSWDLIIGYEDNDCSSTCMCEQIDLREMLEDAYIDSYDICFPDPFDIIVVTNFYQISRNKDVINYLLDEGTLKVPVFCIETGTLVTNDPENIEGILLTIAEINEKRVNYYKQQDDGMFNYEE